MSVILRKETSDYDKFRDNYKDAKTKIKHDKLKMKNRVKAEKDRVVDKKEAQKPE